MKILIAVDGSPHSLGAVAALADRIGWFGEAPKITLLHAHPQIPYKVAPYVGRDVIAKYYDEESDEALAGARRLLEARGIAFTVENRVGDAADEIIRHAAAGGFDLIAMGTHGHTALVNLVMGSVATRVLASGKVPVLFLRQ